MVQKERSRGHRYQQILYTEDMIRRIFLKIPQLLLVAIIVCIAGSYPALASPFGQGVFGADVPFGSGTSMSIALDGTVHLTVDTPSGGTFSGNGSHTVTVTSTDVVGYRLYVYAPGSATMTNGSDTVPASSNTVLGTLATDTWGYNTTGSTTNFIGVTTAPVTIRDATGPHKNGDTTTITYGMKVDQTKGAGEYSAMVVYTAVGKSE